MVVTAYGVHFERPGSPSYGVHFGHPDVVVSPYGVHFEHSSDSKLSYWAGPGPSNVVYSPCGEKH